MEGSVQKISMTGTKLDPGVGELRQDLVTGKWVVIATARAKRPDDFASDRQIRELPKFRADCVFCDLATFAQEPDVLRLPDDADTWQVHIFGNKYPAFRPEEDFCAWSVGPYRASEAVGYHEVLATRHHHQVDARISVAELALQLEALVLRYRKLKQKTSVNYIQIIKNHGPEAGGSVEHPHHQIFTVPVLPSDIQDILLGAERYGREKGDSPYTAMLAFEREDGSRMVWENDAFTAFCPYASRVPFEVWIMPREHERFFDNIDPGKREQLAEVMKQVFERMYWGLHDPPYNYYIHSAPCDNTGFVCDLEEFQHTRWHVQILPRLAVWGGFELGTGLEINTAMPEESAAFLRQVKIG